MNKFYLKCFKEIKTGFISLSDLDNMFIISEISNKEFNKYGLKIFIFIEYKHCDKLKSFLDIIKDKQITNCNNIIEYVSEYEPIVHLSDEELFYIKLKYGELFDE